MKKRRFVVSVSVFLAIAAFLGVLIVSPHMVYSNNPAGCYYCAWNNNYQKYECKLYDGPGYTGCSIPPGGSTCTGNPAPYCGM